ncbi:nickel-dependent hydrogenase large subunit [Desulfobaculum bizertense]|uniref:Nickel-dependent hydrogenase n=1 Tax=Desulfobaculum bizertense DSM 18034 TaxID=1121442 RepID=A0A1T4WCV5_9BACT|nr:nickel-dependent hydrogenase large subunit [Desulfobaculum bizertense]UIJ37394.1 nickel-dependent hydrogenase large subunit [Desulfobaculum bizertense]SKA75123.1 Nickel-dependent hydrogenase [Desulfobaculum bizertense DSM 18034]
MAKTIIPFGPQHPVLPEPIHLKLVVEDEIVQEAIPALGFVHRGLEKLTEIKDIHQMVYVVERVCGICSCIHAMNYCHCIEDMMDIEVPDRAQHLRMIWSELHRMHSHLLWLGLFADAFGFEALFQQIWKLREKVMDINEATAGNRVIVSVNIIGGVRRDLSPEQIRWILQQIDEIDQPLHDLRDAMLNDYTVKKRTCGIGMLPPDVAIETGACGPTLRGSGIAQDCRQLEYECFDRIDFEPVTHPQCDSWARCAVRFDEVLQSIDIIRQSISRLPAGDLATPFKGYPEGEIIRRTEQPRGELMYYVKGSGKKYLDRVRIRTPTFANIPPLLHMLGGIELADVPVVVLSIDPCISCTER